MPGGASAGNCARSGKLGGRGHAISKGDHGWIRGAAGVAEWSKPTEALSRFRRKTRRGAGGRRYRCEARPCCFVRCSGEWRSSCSPGATGPRQSRTSARRSSRCATRGRCMERPRGRDGEGARQIRDEKADHRERQRQNHDRRCHRRALAGRRVGVLCGQGAEARRRAHACQVRSRRRGQAVERDVFLPAGGTADLPAGAKAAANIKLPEPKMAPTAARCKSSAETSSSSSRTHRPASFASTCSMRSSRPSPPPIARSTWVSSPTAGRSSWRSSPSRAARSSPARWGSCRSGGGHHQRESQRAGTGAVRHGRVSARRRPRNQRDGTRVKITVKPRRSGASKATSTFAPM